MNFKALQLLIQNSELPPMQKNIMTGFINRAEHAEAKRQYEKDLIEKVGLHGKQSINEIILSTDEVKIYTITGPDDWDTKYPYRSIFLDSKDVWRSANTVSPTLDTAMLVYLEKKHTGENSQFSDFAMKMLNIKLEE